MTTTGATATLERVGHRIRQLRSDLGLSMRELAEQSGASQRFVFELEKGGANVSIAKLEPIAKTLGCELYELLRPAEPSSVRRRLDRALLRCTDNELEALARTLNEGRPRRDRVALLGMRGAGKSTVGRALARRLGMRFIELDSRIEERAAISLGDIFSMHGPEYYEELEAHCLEELLENDDPMVLATGGGIVTHETSYEMLRRNATCVWLKAEPETHWQRVIQQGDLRPMANNPRAFEELCSILETREPLYAESDLTIETDALGVEAIVEDVATFVESRRATD